MILFQTIKRERDSAMKQDFALHDIVEMKKNHPCGENRWKIIRMGADIRIKCLGCDRSIMIPRVQFAKKMKRIIEKSENV